MLDVRAVSKRYGAASALVDVSLFLDRGTSCALLGANGAGKTTLLRLAAGLERPTGGEVRVAGFDPSRDAAAARGRLGYAGHDPALYDDLTVAENLRFVVAYHLPRARVEDAVLRALTAFGLAERADDRAGALSRGWRQRAALARATAHDPPLLLLDEPFASLDDDGARLLERILAERQAAGGVTLWSTHDAQRARLAGRTLRLAAGRAEAPA